MRRSTPRVDVDADRSWTGGEGRGGLADDEPCMRQRMSCYARRAMTTLFGNPGSNELTFLDRLPDDFRYVLALHEGAGLAMAECYSQVTGRPVWSASTRRPAWARRWARSSMPRYPGRRGRDERPAGPTVDHTSGPVTNVDATSCFLGPGQGKLRGADAPRSVPDVLARAVHLAVAAPSGPGIRVRAVGTTGATTPTTGPWSGCQRVRCPAVHVRCRIPRRRGRPARRRAHPLLVLGAEVDASRRLGRCSGAGRAVRGPGDVLDRVGPDPVPDRPSLLPGLSRGPHRSGPAPAGRS
jgi:hypothetical protein